MSGIAQYGQLGKAAQFQLSDRYLQASKVGNLIGFVVALAAFGWVIAHPPIFGLPEPQAVDENIPVTMELWEAPPEDLPVFEEISELGPIPEPVPIPDPEPEPEPEPAPEPERAPEPLPAKKPPPPKPIAKPKAKPAPRPLAPEVTEAAAPAAVPKATEGDSRKFVSAFLRLVENSKFYPNEAKRQNITGTVKVRVSFNSAGEITGTSLVPGEYHAVLGQAALATVSKAKGRWKPRAGAPDALVVPIAFKIR
ncbi:MAG: energy transducer TonB [Deltaproteobacteria bacterium]|nr:energy transducer TonB [Deltaproteobacteria bacterium]